MASQSAIYEEIGSRTKPRPWGPQNTTRGHQRPAKETNMNSNGFITRIRLQVAKLEARQEEHTVSLALVTEELQAAQVALRHADRPLQRRA